MPTQSARSSLYAVGASLHSLSRNSRIGKLSRLIGNPHHGNNAQVPEIIILFGYISTIIPVNYSALSSFSGLPDEEIPPKRAINKRILIRRKMQTRKNTDRRPSRIALVFQSVPICVRTCQLQCPLKTSEIGTRK